ncbi:MAG: flagellar hook-associated protein 3 [Desulfobacteraceae bacterium 4572_187]|nr:MAG: flagellar hook-associated protein 3 [Desulfobacteraceae bacterium 4572_187]
MRVANKTIYDSITYNLRNCTQEMNKSNEIVSTGKRINNLSDDPVGLTQALNVRSAISNIEQMQRNISLGNSWLASSESALTHVEDIISDTKVLCIQMANATIGSAERLSAAGTVQNMLDEIISLANTNVAGSYIFSGSKTDTTPFSDDGTYNGNSNAFTVKIGKDATIEVGGDGDAVFGNIFTTMDGLKTALMTNDVGGIQNAMSNLDGHFDDISAKISDVGSKMNRMDVKEKIFQDLNFANTDRLSKIEDAEIIWNNRTKYARERRCLY